MTSACGQRTQLQWLPGQPFRHLYSSSARHADSPAVLAQWIVKQGGTVDGIAVQPAGDGTGYSLWSSQVTVTGSKAEGLCSCRHGYAVLMSNDNTFTELVTLHMQHGNLE